jgi:anaphase-promoting complex subunit 6
VALWNKFDFLLYLFFDITARLTSLDGTFAPAWIGVGNAYAAQEEGDQAMSAYRTAARLFPG